MGLKIPDVDDAMKIIEEPPRANTKAALPQVCKLRRSACARTRLFVDEAESYDELRSSSSLTQHVRRTSRFHSHTKLNTRTAEDFMSSDLACWTCCHTFTGPVVPIPSSFDAKENVFVVFGNFCSPACAKRHILDNPSHESGMMLVLMERLAREVFGHTHVVASPPRLSLAIFGGHLSIDNFRALSERCETTIVKPPYVNTYMVSEEKENGEHRLSSMGVAVLGTVHGLRRPAQPIPMLRQTPKESPYLEFLAQKGVATEDPSEPEIPAVSAAPGGSAAAATRSRSKEASSNTNNGGGLTRFMRNS